MRIDGGVVGGASHQAEPAPRQSSWKFTPRFGTLPYLRRQRPCDASPGNGGRVTGMALLAHIRAIHAVTREAYGWPRIWRELRGRGVRVGKGFIFHSDRGSQYASADFQNLLKQHGMRGSMSRKGNCWDNAGTEALFGSFKVERLHGMRCETWRAAMDEAVDWLAFYNRKRLHSTLGYKSPMAFEEIWRRQKNTLAA